jgi:chitodextrinase
VTATSDYYIFVRHSSGLAPEWFQLNVFSKHDLTSSVSDQSIANPAESSNSGMLAVGASNWETPDTIESFSSRGPTTDKRIKPDIVGTDRGDSVSYGVNGFSGTSQASPHVAGLAALVRERFPAYTPQQVATYLKDNASGVGTVPNSTWGYGLAQMPLFEPTAPIDVTATSGVRQATVAWSAPLDDGGSPVTEYAVTSDPGNVTATTTGTSVTVIGLTNGTSYTFTVTAANSIGTSSSSDTSNAVTTPTAPGAPTDLSAKPEDTQALVSWIAPVSDGRSPITGYTVTSDPDGVTATTANTSVTVTGLTQNTVYTFTVTAKNAAGTGSSSEPSSSVITKLTNIWDAPSMSQPGIIMLVIGMLGALLIFLTKSRPGTKARKGLSG